MPETRETEEQSAAAALERHDPWSGNSRRPRRFFAASTAIHVGLLVLFATLTVTVVKTVEKIDVRIVDQVGVEESGGADSLEDFAGLLNVAQAPRRDAGAAARSAGAQRARPAGAEDRRHRSEARPRTGGRRRRVDQPVASASNGIGGLGGNFGDYVGGLRKVGLDLVLVIDTTESMQFVIDEVKARADLPGGDHPAHGADQPRRHRRRIATRATSTSSSGPT